MRTTAIIAAIALLSGCATPPPQVQTVYVPMDTAAARKERNGECVSAMLMADIFGKKMLDATRRCKKNPTRNSDGCVEMRAVMKFINDKEIIEKSSSCLTEYNAGGYSPEAIMAHLKNEVETVKIIKTLPISVLD